MDPNNFFEASWQHQELFEFPELEFRAEDDFLPPLKPLDMDSASKDDIASISGLDLCSPSAFLEPSAADGLPQQSVTIDTLSISFVSDAPFSLPSPQPQQTSPLLYADATFVPSPKSFSLNTASAAPVNAPMFFPMLSPNQTQQAFNMMSMAMPGPILPSMTAAVPSAAPSIVFTSTPPAANTESKEKTSPMRGTKRRNPSDSSTCSANSATSASTASSSSSSDCSGDDEENDDGEEAKGKGRRGRKPASSAKGDDKASKRERNKVSASAYRKRRKVYLDGLEHKVETLTSQVTQQSEQVTSLATENKMLREQLEYFKNMLSLKDFKMPSMSSFFPSLPVAAPVRVSSSSSSPMGPGGLMMFALLACCMLIFAPGFFHHYDSAVSSAASSASPMRTAGRSLMSVSPFDIHSPPEESFFQMPWTLFSRLFPAGSFSFSFGNNSSNPNARWSSMDAASSIFLCDQPTHNHQSDAAAMVIDHSAQMPTTATFVASTPSRIFSSLVSASHQQPQQHGQPQVKSPPAA